MRSPIPSSSRRTVISNTPKNDPLRRGLSRCVKLCTCRFPVLNAAEVGLLSAGRLKQASMRRSPVPPVGAFPVTTYLTRGLKVIKEGREILGRPPFRK